MNQRSSETETLFRGFRLITMTGQPGSDLGLIPSGAILVQHGRITWVGTDSEIPSDCTRLRSVQGEGRFLSPGLIDCHTHVIWGGSRVAEWEARLGGATYESIASAGGGILSTVRATRQATTDELYADARRRLEYVLHHGVTGVEIKSGYGLSLAEELRILQVATELRDSMPLEVSRTLLAAHAIPPEFHNDPARYVDLVCDSIIPASLGHCEAVDVFCESIAFTLPQAERILRTAAGLGLGTKIHAEQRTLMNGAQMAASLNAWSADHLEYLDSAGVDAMARHGTVAVLLPGAFYFLREKQLPPLEKLRRQGVPLAVASDMNPGSSPVASLLCAMNMSCVLYGLTPIEAWWGVTRHAARALRWDDRVGALEIGKQADFAVWEIEQPAELPYGIGHTPCVAVYRHGECVWSEFGS